MTLQRPDKRAVEQDGKRPRPARRKPGWRSEPGRRRRTGRSSSATRVGSAWNRSPAALHGLTESFDAKVMCRCLDRLVGHFDRKLRLTIDRHSAHCSETFRTWLASHKDRIELNFPPSYPSELNPEELVNADLKHSLPRHTIRPDLPPRSAASSADASHTSSVGTSVVRTSATSWMGALTSF
ncbi:transposase [Streptomyces sp. F63]|uniref:transposase n=1 Tax=Streptomyces sp. F63 TaxID=2824887 RepID=UPI001B360AC5|nr:transposase [Streptomyces sp. F63]